MCEAAIFEVAYRETEGLNLNLASPGTFEWLLGRVRAGLTQAGVGSVAPEEVQVQVAMAILGPGSGVPGDRYCADLQAMAAQYCKRREADNDLEYREVLDLVAAFGGGWRRKVKEGPSTWETLWPGSSTYIQLRLRHVIRRVGTSLKSELHVAVPKTELTDDDDGLDKRLSQTASGIAAKLIWPTVPVSIQERLHIEAGKEGDPIYAGLTMQIDNQPSVAIPTGTSAVYSCIEGGARDSERKLGFKVGHDIRLTSSETESHVWVVPRGEKKKFAKPSAGQKVSFKGAARLDLWQCACGSAGCEQRHRLVAWDPGKEYKSLDNFLFVALKGEMSAIKTNSFSAGLLAAYWAQYGWSDGTRLVKERVAHHVCTNSSCVERRGAAGPRIYFGDKCDECPTHATVETAIVERELLITVDAPLPRWELKEYWRCGVEQCRPPGLEGEDDSTLIDPLKAIASVVATCGRCGKPFWEGAERLVRMEKLEEIMRSRKNYLQATKAILEWRSTQLCACCRATPGNEVVFCPVCRVHGRTGRLSTRPTWLFVPAPVLASADTDTDPDDLEDMGFEEEAADD